MTASRLSPQQVRTRLLAGGEVALVDVREQRPFADGHILLAVHAPLSRLELALPPLVPCRETQVIFCDGGEGLAERAAGVAGAMGYASRAILEGGTPAWQDAGYRLFSGLNAIGAALAETVDLVCRPAQIAAAEVVRRRQAGDSLVMLDARPWEEYRDHHIPGGIACPGGELVYRVHALAPDPATTVVVHCAGRSRSLYGAQSLIDAGLPNPVFALAEGTHGWRKAGLDLAHGDGPRADGRPGADEAWARAAARGLARVNGVPDIDGATLARWRTERDERSLYLLDVRSPEEFAAGHRAGAVSAPGGQLVECADDWIGVRGGRIVLLDDDRVRAPMAACWLRRMGYEEVAVLDGDGDGEADVAAEPAEPAGPDIGAVPAIGADALGRPDVVLLDLSSGPAFVRDHGKGALWALRSRLPDLLPRLPQGRLAVMDDAGDALAALAVAELAAMGRGDACLLRGGLASLQGAGWPIETGTQGMLHGMDDACFLPADMVEDPMAEAAAYLAWQSTLAQEVAEDGLLVFRLHGAA